VIALIAASAALALAAVFRVQHAPLQCLVLFGLLFGGYAVGRAVAARSPVVLATGIGALFLVAVQSLIQTTAYYTNIPLNAASDAWTVSAALLLSLPLLWLKQPKEKETMDGDREASTTSRDWAWMVLCGSVSFAAAGSMIAVAALHGTTDAIRTPWPLLPAGTIGAFALANISAWLAAWRRLPRWFIALQSVLACASVFFLAPLLYQNGFGFDGFLHRASEDVLNATGTLQPKPPYYIGQYVFVTWLARVFDLPIRLTDAFLVPLFASLLPFGVLAGFYRDARVRWILPALTLFLPLSAFIATTPQSFSYLLGVCAVLLAINGEFFFLPALLVAAWSLAVHPLAGLPFFGACALILWTQRRLANDKRPFRSFLTWILLVATTAAVPLAFFVNGLRSSAHVTWNLGALLHWQTYFNGIASAFALPASHAALWADWASVIAALALWISAGFAFVGAIRNREKRSLWVLCLCLGIGMIAAGFILRTSGAFAFLIDYERGNYADRLFIVALFFFLFPALDGASRAVERCLTGAPTAAIVALLFLAGWQGALFHNALPRHDAAEISRGWSVGHGDQEAVRFIDRDADHQPYTVLANQSVSAAAVEAFGFKRYAGDVFYYPIPTGGPLYQIFLRTAYGDPTRADIKEAATLGQSDRVYLVMNDYWWDAERMNEVLTAIADRAFDVDGGKIRVYRFDFSKTP